MKKIYLFALLLLSGAVSAQKVNGRIRFEPGQLVKISMQVKTTISQQAMGQSMDFTVEATGDHHYKVTNAAEENTTLSHKVDRIRFNFDGMGQKRGFDSDVEKDLNGQIGEPVKEILNKKYDMIVDSTGNTLMTIPAKIALEGNDNRMAMLQNMMKDVFDLVQPPAPGKPSFFKLLPAEPVGLGDGWTESGASEGGTFQSAYSVKAITDTTILLDFASKSTSVTKAEMMGSVTTTSMNHDTKGTILVDRKTGLLREKNTETSSTGTSEGPFGNIPLSSKTQVHIKAE